MKILPVKIYRIDNQRREIEKNGIVQVLSSSDYRSLPGPTGPLSAKMPSSSIQAANEACFDST